MYKFLCQTQIRNKPLFAANAFSVDPGALLCDLPFSVLSSAVPGGHSHRFLRVHLSLVLTDASADRVGRLYLAFTGEHIGSYNVVHEYVTTDTDSFSGVLGVEYFVPVPVGGAGVLRLFIASSSDTCVISPASGCGYSSAFPAGSSYLSVEDVGGLSP